MDPITPCKYNWDDLEVGRHDVNHSEKFFKFRHVKHEKNVYLPKRKTGLRYKTEADEVDDKENESNTLNCPDLLLSHVKETNDINKEQQQDQNQEQQQQQDQNQQQQQQQDQNQQQQPKVKKPIFLKESKFQQKSNNKNSDNGFEVPRAYKYKEIYEKRRQKLIHNIQEQDKKQRLFHSRPAPKFNNIGKPKDMNKTPPEDKITVPITPFVLKKSKELEEQKKIKEKELKAQQVTTFKANEPLILNAKPFKPKKQDYLIEIKPFNLNVEKRLEKRKIFNEKIKNHFEDKKRQQEEEKARKEMELIKEMRKVATFKARPSPF